MKRRAQCVAAHRACWRRAGATIRRLPARKAIAANSEGGPAGRHDRPDKNGIDPRAIVTNARAFSSAVEPRAQPVPTLRQNELLAPSPPRRTLVPAMKSSEFPSRLCAVVLSFGACGNPGPCNRSAAAVEAPAILSAAATRARRPWRARPRGCCWSVRRSRRCAPRGQRSDLPESERSVARRLARRAPKSVSTRFDTSLICARPSPTQLQVRKVEREAFEQFVVSFSQAMRKKPWPDERRHH